MHVEHACEPVLAVHVVPGAAVRGHGGCLGVGVSVGVVWVCIGAGDGRIRMYIYCLFVQNEVWFLYLRRWIYTKSHWPGLLFHGIPRSRGGREQRKEGLLLL